MQGIELPSPARAALLAGQSGILTVAWQLSPDDEIADTLFERVTENAHNDANEIMWGSPGTMLAADAMHEWTGDTRWLAAWQESADELMRRREDDGLWTTRLYGGVGRSLGPAHGLVGNVLALRRRLPAEQREQLERESAATLAARAVVEDGLANWANHAEVADLQWCSGSSRDRHLGGRLPRRGAAPGRSGARLAGGAARRREGLRHLPRDGRERLRALEDVRAHR